MLRIVLFSIVFFPTLSFAETSSVSRWHLPQPLTDANTTVRFEVDSTWHMVHGSTSGITGEASLSTPTDSTSVQVSFKIPVTSFDTDNSLRDDRMKEVMHSDTYPTVSFTGESLTKNCTPARVLRDGTCSDKLRGRLTVLAIEKELLLPITIQKILNSEAKNPSFLIQGKLPVQWSDFGVEDPSILIARLDPIVTVFFEVILRPQISPIIDNG